MSFGESVSSHVNGDYILWADVETSGVMPEVDVLLELGAVITDLRGEVIGNPFQALFSVDNISSVISSSDDTVQSMHDKSGLWRDLWMSKTYGYSDGDEAFLEWINSTLTSYSNLYFGGNSIHLDRNFMRIYLPRSYSLVSYRSIDVTSLSISLQSNLCIPAYEKLKAHRALADAFDSLNEYKHYMGHLSKDTME